MEKDINRIKVELRPWRVVISIKFDDIFVSLQKWEYNDINGVHPTPKQRCPLLLNVENGLFNQNQRYLLVSDTYTQGHQ